MMDIREIGEYSPVQISAVLILIISVIEFVIMGLLHVAGLSFLPLQEAILDSVLLAVFVTPAVYLLLIRPLRESEERFRRIVERSYDAIAILDPSGRITYASPSMASLLGYEREDILGRHFREFVSEEDAGDAEEVFRRVMDGETVEGIEHRLRRKRGEEIEVVGNSSPIEEGEGAIQVVFRDKTELKARERQLQVLDRFLRHNLHNDMNLVLGHAENILERMGLEEAQMIEETANRLIDMTDKEKEVVEIISKERSPEVLEVKELVERAVEKVESDYPGTEVKVSLPREETLEVEALPDFERALYELLENAVVHGKTDEPEVEVSIEPDGMVEISVKDRGERIPEVEVQVLKRKREITPTNHGSGLGLLLIRWIVRRSNGELEFQENEPTGNIITLRLPRPDEMDSG